MPPRSRVSRPGYSGSTERLTLQLQAYRVAGTSFAAVRPGSPKTPTRPDRHCGRVGQTATYFVGGMEPAGADGEDPLPEAADPSTLANVSGTGYWPRTKSSTETCCASTI